MDADSSQKLMSFQVVVEEVLDELNDLYSWDNPDLAEGVRVGTLASKPKESFGIRRTLSLG